MQIKVVPVNSEYQIKVRVHRHRLANSSTYDLLISHCAVCGQLLEIKTPEAYND